MAALRAFRTWRTRRWERAHSFPAFPSGSPSSLPDRYPSESFESLADWDTSSAESSPADSTQLVPYESPLASQFSQAESPPAETADRLADFLASPGESPSEIPLASQASRGGLSPAEEPQKLHALESPVAEKPVSVREFGRIRISPHSSWEFFETFSDDHVVIMPESGIIAFADKYSRVRMYEIDGDGNPLDLREEDIGKVRPSSRLLGRRRLGNPIPIVRWRAMAALGGDVIVFGGVSGRLSTCHAMTGEHLDALSMGLLPDLLPENIWRRPTAIASMGTGEFVVGYGHQLHFFSHSNGYDLREVGRGNKTHAGEIWSIAVRGNVIVTASSDQTAAVWSAATRKRVAVVGGYRSPVVSVAICDRFIATGSRDFIRLYENDKRHALVRVISGLHTNWVNHVSFVGDELLMSASSDKTVAFTSLSDGKPVARLDAGSQIKSVAITPSGQLAVCGGKSLIVSPPASVAKAVMESSKMKVVSTDSDPPLIELPVAENPAGVRQFEAKNFSSCCGTTPASFVDNHVVIVPESGIVAFAHRCTRPLRMYEMDGDGNHLNASLEDTGSGNSPSGMSLDDAISGYENPPVRWRAMAALGGDVIAFGHAETGKVSTCHATTGKLLDTLWMGFIGRDASAIASTRIGEFVVGCGRDLLFVSHSDGFDLHVAGFGNMTHDENISSIAVHDNVIVTGSSDQTAAVWNVETRERVHVLRGYNWPVMSVAISDHFIATGSGDVIRLHENAEGHDLVREIRGLHIDCVNHVSFVGDEMIMSGSSDKTIAFTSLSNGKPIARLNAERCVLSVTVTPDGQLAICGVGKSVTMSPPASVAEAVRESAKKDLVSEAFMQTVASWLISMGLPDATVDQIFDSAKVKMLAQA